MSDPKKREMYDQGMTLEEMNQGGGMGGGFPGGFPGGMNMGGQNVQCQT